MNLSAEESESKTMSRSDNAAVTDGTRRSRAGSALCHGAAVLATDDDASSIASAAASWLPQHLMMRTLTSSVW